ncbi:MAG TPA: hypothetical protein VER33_04395, partial [Polyangiaceae bacterium]|nr:hypothetical protein [Polyangiaceae bacterium]
MISKLSLIGLASVGILGSACSVLYDLSPDQCGSRADCASFGANYRCEAGICVSSVAGRGGAGPGGTGGTAGEGAISGGPNGGISGMPSGGGGSGGLPPVDECKMTKDCLELHGPENPSACVEGKCVDLISDECPVLLPDRELYLDNLAGRDPIIVGAYGHLGINLVSDMTRNYDLAVTELTREPGGVPGLSGTVRPVVFVVCENIDQSRSELEASIHHLTVELKVPGIIAALFADDLQFAFEQSLLAAEAGDAPPTFFMSPLEWTSALGTLQDQNLLWHLLPGGNNVGLTYAPLLARAEQYMRTQAQVPAEAPIKVALATAADERLLVDLRDSFMDTVKLNGVSAPQSRTDGNLLTLSVTSGYDVPDAPLTDEVQAIIDFRPHIVVGATGPEMLTTLIPRIESGWTRNAPDPLPPRPFYILSPYNYNHAPPLTALLNEHRMFELRMAGINFASAEPPAEALALYEQALHDEFLGAAALGYENFYDAAYYMIYALAAAEPQIELNGLDLADAMERLKSGEKFNVCRRRMP